MNNGQFFWFVVWLAGFVSCQSSAQDTRAYLHKNWAQDKLWDDGKAEVAQYDAERRVYGKIRSFDYVYVLVKETFNREYQVKTDRYDRDDLYAVMKVNKFCRIETLKYPYHYLTSLFFKREAPDEVHKLTTTSQEWCGNTAKSFLNKSNRYEYQYMSYWDGQGNGLTKIPKGPWFEDQLSYTLRTIHFQEGLTFEVGLYPMQVSSKADVPKAEMALIQVARPAADELSAVDSTFIRDPWKVSVTREKGANLTFWINGDYPNTLLKMVSTDGRKLVLKSLERDAYWDYE